MEFYFVELLIRGSWNPTLSGVGILSIPYALVIRGWKQTEIMDGLINGLMDMVLDQPGQKDDESHNE
ncbi:unnamed protein product [Dovyalis caffra]|uniref:Uncharacterized protein n=1 Tax=Dovyalis caffra TaxID=77055 RepID=A0AAV1SAP7_9ROSI|nr:unnamed protein product [Dovyalis caffra]